MSSLAAVIADILDDAGLSGLNLARDEPAVQQTSAMPYATLREGISTTTAPSGRGVLRFSELVQLDLVQDRKSAPDDPTLMQRVWTAVDAAGPRATDDQRLYRLQPVQSVRLFNRTAGTVTESLTIRVTRADL